MDEIFLNLVNRSISALWLVLAVIVLRMLFRKAPKWINPVLWGIVGLRLIMPFTVESALSLIPSAEPISPGIMYEQEPGIRSSIPAVNDFLNPMISASFTPDPAASVNPLQIWIHAAACVWMAGVCLMLLYTCISTLRLHRRMKTAVLLRDNIYQSENTASPFVLGMIRPRIYLPFGMEEKDRMYVIAHEQAHIGRYDHWTKFFGFLLLCVYWFSPFVWAAYVLFCRDIELACDERVIRRLGAGQRADYSQALLNCSSMRRRIAACPLAFGESDVKRRVKNVLNYRKPGVWIAAAALVSCAVAAVCFLTDPKENGSAASGAAASSESADAQQTASESTAPQADGQGSSISLRIVDGAETGQLILAGESAWDVYVLDAREVPVYLDGKPADVSALEDGMPAEISYNGNIEETYPAGLGGVTSVSVYSQGTGKNPDASFYDLCGLYLQVLNDLWEADRGLNDGIHYVSVDLSGAPGGLTEGEKAAVAWIFAGTHQVECLELSYEELREQGYLTQTQTGGASDKAAVWQWDDGVLFSITQDPDGAEDTFPVLKFDAAKWRSPLGTYYFSGCSASWPEEGGWSGYSVEAEMIS